MENWNDPQLSDGDMPQDQNNNIHITELNEYLRMLADMNTIGIRRKLVLLQGYIHKVTNIINEGSRED